MLAGHAGLRRIPTGLGHGDHRCRSRCVDHRARRVVLSGS
jgi:hypothetical protein